MALSPEEIREFRAEGVLVVENIVPFGDLEPVIQETSDWVERRARELLGEEKIKDLCTDEPFERRLACLYAQSSEITRGMDIMEARGSEMFAFLRNDRLLDAVASLIGPEITCSPIQHIRAKPPASLSDDGPGFFNVPWHQDAGVTWEEADGSEILTCWLPLVDATVRNGCMEVLPGVWRDGYLEHHADGGTTIRPPLMPTIAPRPVPVRKGGIIFMHRHTPHRSTPNYSDTVRWSMDLRYQPTGTPTGRPFHPEFVARSASHPESALTDQEDWSRRWQEALVTARGIQPHRIK